jgi:hypothetical protein
MEGSWHGDASMNSDLKETKDLMRALVRMRPKPHEDMKVGKIPEG